ncbi:MAG: exodeoxyribonuclease VII large subunit [Firmicutes bacterium]|nr:exodeoxyribonuclease VII large subunit [Bacillota bacterium]
MQENNAADIWSVSGLTGHIKNLLTSDSKLRAVKVRGEISGFKRAYSGHCYFTLKDTGAVITCVMFASRANGVKFDIKDGIKVIVTGSITLYEKNGNYQLLVDRMKPEGVGDIYQQFLMTKEKLMKMGYFDQGRKKMIPFLPKGIGIATSPEGAAIHDMLRTIKNKFPLAKVYIAPTLVQGTEAPASIARSISLLDRFVRVDVIITGRGGGSFEDLNCFNSEIVAEAIYRCRKPVISAVGHEVDFTIADLVADVRAATPTAAAQSVVPDLSELAAALSDDKNRLVQGLVNSVRRNRDKLAGMSPERLLMSVENSVNRKQQDLDRLMDDMSGIVISKAEKMSLKLDRLGETLNALSPFRVLERGYTIVKDSATGNVVARGADALKADNIDIVFADMEVKAEIKRE